MNPRDTIKIKQEGGTTAGPLPVSRFLHRNHLPSFLRTQGEFVKDVSYYEKADTITQAEYVRLQCNCVLCCTALEFKFEMITASEIKEEATCPQCEIRARAKIHSLQ